MGGLVGLQYTETLLTVHRCVLFFNYQRSSIAGIGRTEYGRSVPFCIFIFEDSRQGENLTSPQFWRRDWSLNPLIAV